MSRLVDLGELTSSVLVFGGPYSNLAATEALLAKAQALNIDPQNVICSGDVVAYCAEPEQTCCLIRDSGIQVVMGNCEESLAANRRDCGCGFEQGMLCDALSAQWYRYAQQQVSQHSRDWMAGLPAAIEFVYRAKRFRVIHGGIRQINQFIFPSTDARLKQQQLEEAQVDGIIGGHCGIPFAERIGEQYWLNAGVIGMPANDGTRQGWYMLMDRSDEGIVISWHRLDYPVHRSYQSMQLAGLNRYAQSLQSGLWPSADILPLAEQSAQGRALAIPDVLIRARAD